MDYKSYQQVIDLSIRPKKKITKNKTTRTRTKTGCLTCRKRKKKCDENVINGKCQGCTRNFIDCSWQITDSLICKESSHPIDEAERERRLSISSTSSTTSLVSLNEPATPRSPRSPVNYPIEREVMNAKFVITSLQHNQLCSIND